MSDLVLPSATLSAFTTFTTTPSHFALPLVITLTDTTLTLTPLHSFISPPTAPFQASLNTLEDVISPRIPLFIILRRGEILYAITYIPYLAKEDERKALLECRREVVKVLGREKFDAELICKEVGEVCDERSWIERDRSIGFGNEGREAHECDGGDGCEGLEGVGRKQESRDLGYKANKCRLCDRRMKNKIEPEALEALGKLDEVGMMVQITLHLPTSTLTHHLTTPSVPPTTVPSLLPPLIPTYTFYQHPSGLLYFIAHCPDSCSVQARMQHTMGIPALISLHAPGVGARVDEKIEIQDAADLVFEGKDKRVGRYRSVYARGGWVGTELQYQGMEEVK
ncbi:hypothetical protein IQ07DRAFT_645917 [Pyrenochaeta sp. DS3sAY3a]|nr:hypothetical protein IQ07DRAFT_645917 [Pyrenochaeta sp. DS3sAY3a]